MLIQLKDFFFSTITILLLSNSPSLGQGNYVIKINKAEAKGIRIKSATYKNNDLTKQQRIEIKFVKTTKEKIDAILYLLEFYDNKNLRIKDTAILEKYTKDIPAPIVKTYILDGDTEEVVVHEGDIPKFEELEEKPQSTTLNSYFYGLPTKFSKLKISILYSKIGSKIYYAPGK